MDYDRRLRHTVSSQNFRSLSFSGFKVIKKYNNQDHVNFFREIVTYTSRLLQFHEKRNLSLTISLYLIFFFFLIALYGARVLGSVFRMKFRVLSREFESIEISPGFAQLLGENWN